MTTHVYIKINLGLLEFDNEAIAISALKEYTQSDFTEFSLENFNWKPAKAFKESELFLRIGTKTVILTYSRIMK